MGHPKIYRLLLIIPIANSKTKELRVTPVSTSPNCDSRINTDIMAGPNDENGKGVEAMIVFIRC